MLGGYLERTENIYSTTYDLKYMYPIAGVFRGHLFSRISRISASRKKYFREILGATPSSRSVPTWVWSGFGLIAKIFFTKFAKI